MYRSSFPMFSESSSIIRSQRDENLIYIWLEALKDHYLEEWSVNDQMDSKPSKNKFA
jgi:hypothetical protein